MNFFEHQQQARKKTRLLVVFFLLAVAVLVVVANLAVMLAVSLMSQPLPASLDALSVLTIQFSWRVCLLTTIVVISAIVAAVIVKNASLRQGAHQLAVSLGGRLIAPNTTDARERRVLNVVAEMALASGMPVPDVYVLHAERGINAFSAGYCPSDAVIGVTRGCLEQLDRAQLQGVIAHEFSHILNGDLRLNMRLIAVLFGIMFVGQLGQQVLRLTAFGAGARVGKVAAMGAVLLAILGGFLIIVGWLGNFLGQLIRTAIVRQREYLADAAAVQFTRHPDGIVSALRLIGGYDEGSEVFNIHVLEMGHLFFCNALLRPSLLAPTHPSLASRIRRLFPDWDGRYIVRVTKSKDELLGLSRAAQVGGFMTNILGARVAAASVFGVTHLTAQQKRGVAQISALVQDPLGATILCYAVLLSAQDAIKAEQKAYLEKSAPAGTLAGVAKIEAPLALIATDERLSLLALSFPGLRRLSYQQYLDFKHNLLFLIKADKKISLFEWCVYQLICHYLDKAFGVSRPPAQKYLSVNQLADPVQTVLSMLVHAGTHDARKKATAFFAGANLVGLYTDLLLPPESLVIDDFTRAVKQLARSSPTFKDRFTRAMIATARSDKRLSAMEKGVITSVAAAIDAPLARELLDEILEERA